MQSSVLFPVVADFTNNLLKDVAETLTAERKELLLQLVDYIHQKLQENGEVHLNFICTHNSRRSHISQIWAAAGAQHFKLSNVFTYSGGTEATAFQPRAIAAMERAGFQISTDDTGKDNPVYSVQLSEQGEGTKAWSKRFDDEANPKESFAAIMTCSDADQNCPWVPGTDKRIPLTFEDPKVADGTPAEAVRYDQAVREIGRELLWVMREVALRPF
ncbi:MAG: protein-tyrosine-phosphatase [Bacteroidota bacterium]